MAISPAIRLRPRNLFESSADIPESAALFKSDRISVWRRSAPQSLLTTLSTQCIGKWPLCVRVGHPFGRFALSANSKRRGPRGVRLSQAKPPSRGCRLQYVPGLIRRHQKCLSLCDRCGNRLQHPRRYHRPLYELLKQTLPGFSRRWGE